MEKDWHMARLDESGVKEIWYPAYKLFKSSPVLLLGKLETGGFCYGGEEIRADLIRRIHAQRIFPESLDFNRWWLEMATTSRGRWRSEEGKAWEKLRVEVYSATHAYLRKEQCIHRHVYRIRSRNLVKGAYNEATGGFNGIREKFGRRYIFEEYHWDNGPPFGTVHPHEDLGPLPDGIEPVETLGRKAEDGREVWFDRSAADPEGDATQRYGRQRYVDTNEFVPKGRRVYSIPNDKLFEYLDSGVEEEE